MIRIDELKIRPGEPDALLREKACRLLGIKDRDVERFRILRRSIDARKKPELYFVCSVLLQTGREEKLRAGFGRGKLAHVSIYREQEWHMPEPGSKILTHPPVIIGFGPAGIFCAYELARAGYRPVVLERGKRADLRKEDVERFWQEGVLLPDSNVSFGEGGAGAFSDGKLQSSVKDPTGRGPEVFRTLVRFGAKEEILYDAKPHLGTDRLLEIIPRIREEILRLGGEVHFETRVTEFLTEGNRIKGVRTADAKVFPAEAVVAAIGHSARDTMEELYREGLRMEAKPFAVGFRVQHLQEIIDRSQYGFPDPHAADPRLGAASYKLTQTVEGRGVFSFCMCPGGYVVNASTEEGGTVVNGMSYSGRSGKNANSAVIVSVDPSDYPSHDPLAGIAFQRELERRTYEAGRGKVPVQRLEDYRLGRAHAEDPFADSPLQPQIKGAFCWSDLGKVLPEELRERFLTGMDAFGKKIPGFDAPETILAGIESRTSSPVRIERGEDLQGSVAGLYPCGEGAGYAGGITSAAMDGIRVAEQIAGEYAPPGKTLGTQRPTGADG